MFAKLSAEKNSDDCLVSSDYCNIRMKNINTITVEQQGDFAFNVPDDKIEFDVNLRDDSKILYGRRRLLIYIFR